MTDNKLVKEVKQIVVEFKQDDAQQASALRCFLAGGSAGAVSRTLVTPLTVIKTLSQLSPDHAHSWKETTKLLYRAGGFKMFWLGNVPGLIRIFPHAGVKFATYDVLSCQWVNPEVSPYRGRFFAGLVAGAVASVLFYPLDILKSNITWHRFGKLAAGSEMASLAWVGAARDLWRQGGWTRGLGISVVGSSLHNGFLFMGYYSVRSWWRPSDDAYLPFFAGGVLAGVLAQMTYPLDLIRRTALHSNLHAYDTAQRIISSDGVLGLYRGSVANLVKVAPYFGVQFLLYEVLLRHRAFD